MNNLTQSQKKSSSIQTVHQKLSPRSREWKGIRFSMKVIGACKLFTRNIALQRQWSLNTKKTYFLLQNQTFIKLQASPRKTSASTPNTQAWPGMGIHWRKDTVWTSWWKKIFLKKITPRNKQIGSMIWIWSCPSKDSLSGKWMTVFYPQKNYFPRNQKKNKADF